MSFFKYYPKTISGVSVTPFTLVYTILLVIALLYIGVVLLIGANQNDRLRRRTLRILLVFLVVLEVINQTWLLSTGSYDVKQHLPLHLCGFMIWMMPLSFITDSKLLQNFTYFAGIFGGLMALLFNYNRAPWFNIQTIQTFSVHATIVLIPLFNVLFLGFRPSRYYFRKSVFLLMFLAACIYVVNVKLGSNYFFLMEAVDSSPLAVLEAIVGYPWVIPVALAGIVFIWYLMFIFFEKAEKKRQQYVVSAEYIERQIRIIR